MPSRPWNLNGRQAAVFWLRVSHPRVLGAEPKVELTALSGEQRVYAQGGTDALLAALKGADTWPEVRVPLAQIKPGDTRVAKLPLEQVAVLTLALQVNTPEVFTEVV